MQACDEGTPVSVRICERRKAAGQRFHANDNIAAFIESGEEAVTQLADLQQKRMQPDGLADVVEAEHFCMTWRGVRDVEAKMINSVMRPGHPAARACTASSAPAWPAPTTISSSSGVIRNLCFDTAPVVDQHNYMRTPFNNTNTFWGLRASEPESFSDVAERRVQRRPIEAQSTAIARAMASICNDERVALGVTSGHG